MQRWNSPAGDDDVNEFLLDDNVSLSFEIERLKRRSSSGGAGMSKIPRSRRSRMYMTWGPSCSTIGLGLQPPMGRQVGPEEQEGIVAGEGR